MNKTNRSLAMILVLSSIGILGCKSQANTNAPDRAGNVESEKAAIINVQTQWETAFKNRDAAALANLFTEDCVRMPNGAPTTIGREALETAYRKEFANIWKTKFDA